MRVVGYIFADVTYGVVHTKEVARGLGSGLVRPHHARGQTKTTPEKVPRATSTWSEFVRLCRT